MQEAGSRTEKIGQVTLDYTYYPGEDYYCDGAVEDEILEIVQNNPAECFEKIIREKKSWPVAFKETLHDQRVPPQRLRERKDHGR